MKLAMQSKRSIAVVVSHCHILAVGTLYATAPYKLATLLGNDSGLGSVTSATAQVITAIQALRGWIAFPAGCTEDTHIVVRRTEVRGTCNVCQVRLVQTCTVNWPQGCRSWYPCHLFSIDVLPTKRVTKARHIWDLLVTGLNSACARHSMAETCAVPLREHLRVWKEGISNQQAT